MSILNFATLRTHWPTTTTFKSVRAWDAGVGWGSIQPKNGTSFEWTTLDSFLAIASAQNVDVLYTFGLTPYWALAKNIGISSITRTAAGVVTVTTSLPHSLFYNPVYAPLLKRSIPMQSS